VLVSARTESGGAVFGPPRRSSCAQSTGSLPSVNLAGWSVQVGEACARGGASRDAAQVHVRVTARDPAVFRATVRVHLRRYQKWTGALARVGSVQAVRSRPSARCNLQLPDHYSQYPALFTIPSRLRDPPPRPTPRTAAGYGAATSASPGMAPPSPAPAASENADTGFFHLRRFLKGTAALTLAACRQSARYVCRMIALLRCRATDMRVRIRLAMELLAPRASIPFWSGAPQRCGPPSEEPDARRVSPPVSWPGGWSRGGSSRSAREQRRGNPSSECGLRRSSHASLPLPC